MCALAHTLVPCRVTQQHSALDSAHYNLHLLYISEHPSFRSVGDKRSFCSCTLSSLLGYSQRTTGLQAESRDSCTAEGATSNLGLQLTYSSGFTKQVSSRCWPGVVWPGVASRCVRVFEEPLYSVLECTRTGTPLQQWETPLVDVRPS